MEKLLTLAQSIKDELIQNRRYLHTIPELAFDLPQTTAFVKKKLEEYGYKPETVGKSGIVCTVGKGDKTIMLRADMDGLPMPEDTDLPFKSDNGKSHSCGHDMHTTMLLGAAKLLKDNEDSLCGCVKFMFQPAEEILAGAEDMINAGLLKGVDAAMAIHIAVGKDDSKTGVVFYNDGPITYATDALKIRITGTAAHGSTPSLGVDANVIAAHIILGLENILARETVAYDDAVAVVGKMSGGTAINTVSGYAELELSPRTVSEETRNFVNKRVEEIAVNTAKAFRGEATVERMYGITFLQNNPDLCKEMAGYCVNLLGDSGVQRMQKFIGSEDFALISQEVPSVLFTLGVGSTGEGHAFGLHHASMHANEDALHVGAATYAHCAAKWLENHSGK